MTDDLVEHLRELARPVSFGNVVPAAGTFMLQAADRIERLEDALRKLDTAVAEFLDAEEAFQSDELEFEEYSYVRNALRDELYGARAARKGEKKDG
jgi:7-keto-8-aminopelargonate synthetase-like enzyme